MAKSAETTVHDRSPGIDSVDVENESVQRASTIAGVGLLLLAVFAAFGEFVVLQNLVTRGDATQTATDITNSESMFRLAIGSLFSVIVLDVVVAWALFTVFEPVSRRLSLLAAWFRFLYSGVFLLAIGQLVGVLRMLNNAEHLAVFSTEQVHAQALLRINTFYDIWDAGLILFGVNLLLLGYLVYRTEYVPTIVGVLLGVAGLGYLIDSFGSVLFSGYSIELATVTFVGEVVLIFWLLIKGRHVTVNTEMTAPRE